MSVDQKVSIFTTSMRTEFMASYEAEAKPPKWQNWVQIIPSNARIEHYTWMSPVPGISRYKGHRNYGQIEAVKYSVENLEFQAGVTALLRDINDDQIGGYPLRFKDLAAKARNWPGRWTMIHLANGASRTCFDGTNFFANSHDIGTGDNLLTGTGSANADGLAYKLVALFLGGPLKPLLWQNRMGPDLENNAGTPQSREAKSVRYWVDMEGEAAFGWWWNAIQYTFTNLPTVTEMHEAFAQIEFAFRSFALPTGLQSDQVEYLYEQEVFTRDNLTIIGSTRLAETLRQALAQDWVPQTIGASAVSTTNRFFNWADYHVSRYLDYDVDTSNA